MGPATCPTSLKWIGWNNWKKILPYVTWPQAIKALEVITSTLNWIVSGNTLSTTAVHEVGELHIPNTLYYLCRRILHRLKFPNALQDQPHVEHITVVQTRGHKGEEGFVNKIMAWCDMWTQCQCHVDKIAFPPQTNNEQVMFYQILFYCNTWVSMDTSSWGQDVGLLS